jgi:antitoxin ParD1/3/4
VIRAGLEALDREEAELDYHFREKVKEALNDSRPDIPMEEVFERLERKHGALMAAAEREP